MTLNSGVGFDLNCSYTLDLPARPYGDQIWTVGHVAIEYWAANHLDSGCSGWGYAFRGWRVGSIDAGDYIYNKTNFGVFSDLDFVQGWRTVLFILANPWDLLQIELQSI